MARLTPFNVTISNRRYTGAWEIDGKDVLVSSAHGSARAPVGRAKPENVAVRLLTGIVEGRG